MKLLTEIEINDRNNTFYFAPWHNLNDNGIELSLEENAPIDGWGVYEIDEDGLSKWLLDGSQEVAKFWALKLNNDLIASESLQEAITDIALQVGNAKFISIDSRLVVSLIISWAKDFEKINASAEWGVNTELDYLESIEQFAEIKIAEAIKNGDGYIDTEN